MSIPAEQTFRERETSLRPRYQGETLCQEPGENSDWHTHDFGQLISANYGSMYVGTPERLLLLSPAMAIWIPPDTKHWLRYVSANEMLYVDVNRTEARELGSDYRIISMSPLLNALFVATTADKSAEFATHHADALFDLLRYELVAAEEVPLSVVMPEDRRIHGLAQNALGNPGEIASVKEWLAGAPASRKTIERLFFTETSMSPSQWLRHVRILHSISMLAAGEKVSTVAFDMGYQSSSAFSYMFRQTLGVSPSDFFRK